MEDAGDFGAWLKRRRRELDLTQQQLAECAACSTVTIRKFEARERRPSRELAELLSGCLGIPAAQRDNFVAFARGLQPQLDPAQSPAAQMAPPAIPAAARGKQFSLPIPPAPFVGRAAELVQISRRLADPACRLLTIVGPGGIGKTRLALAAAGAASDGFVDGVVFASLAAVHDAASIPQTIARALNITLTGSGDPAVQLGRYLQARHLLVVLDNFESVLDGVDLLAGWLQQAPNAKWLVTSRERLNLAEEWLLPLQGLDTTEAGMALFAQVASRVRPDFSLAEQAATVSQICAYVGGMPLAIELAAGWAATLSCEQILAQMQQTFDFLSTSLRNVPQRHRSLRHLFDQSWDLLEPVEQRVLMKLSLFRGGFAQEEAGIVAGATTVLLRRLADRSLLLADGSGRFYLHELTRQYAAEKLEASGEEAASRQGHAGVFLALAEEFELQRSGPAAIAWYERMEAERANMDTALGWLDRTGAVVESQRLANALWWFWFRRGYWHEAELRLAALVGEGAAGDNRQACLALLYYSTIIALQGRYAEAAPYLMQAMAMARGLNNPVVLAGALTVLGQAVPDAGAALAAFLEARAILQQEQGERPAMMLALLDNLIGERLQKNGRHEEAAGYYQHSLDLYRSRGNVDLIAYPLGNLGRLALQDGRFDVAQALIGEALALSRDSGNRQGTADWLLPLARLHLIDADAATAAAHYQDALLLFREMGNWHGQAAAMAGLAHAALEAGDPEAAQKHIHDSLATYAKIYVQTRQADAVLSTGAASLSTDVIDCLAIAALSATANRQYERAAVLFAVAEKLGQPLQYQPDPRLAQQIGEAVSTARRHHGPSQDEHVHATAPAGSLDEVFRFALEDNRKNPPRQFSKGLARVGHEGLEPPTK